jgi:crossover junction endodeoxyribonuclease RuvC
MFFRREGLFPSVTPAETGVVERILGIDPGSRCTGFGVIERHQRRLSYVASGCIRAEGDHFFQRLHTIFNGVREVVALYAPLVVVVEQVFVHRNVDTAIKLGQARGAAICAVLEQGLTVHEYTPAAIKKAIVGRGAATKAQIQHMVVALLNLPATPQADAADALAIALCHAHSDNSLLRQAVGGGR